MTTAGLAGRLRSLRTTTWPRRRITQGQLAAAFGISPALISSWENAKNAAVPPTDRLEAYARFFATERSVAREPYQVLPITELTPDERKSRQTLLDELLGAGDAGPESPFEDATLRFPANEDITIVCSELPLDRRNQVPYANPDGPDYVEAYKYADLDALLELFGHVRAANPSSQVQHKVAREMVADDYITHLVLLGGVDWNLITTEVMTHIDLPVRQRGRDDDSSLGGFEVDEVDQRTLFEPVVKTVGARTMLRKDVAQFIRAVNPFNKERTVTICNGMYQAGTLGVVRALTDERLRARNERYLRERFAGQPSFSVLSRVEVRTGVVGTPDWSLPDVVLHEWPARDDG